MQTALTVAGYAIGSAIGGPMGSAALGGAIGGMLGAYIGASLLPDTTTHGPRMEDRRVQISTYGAPIPRLWGAVRIAGNVIWAADLEEVVSEEEVGGKGGPSTTVVNYSYYATCAVLLGFGPVLGIRRIWADAALIYDGSLEISTVLDVDFVFYGGTEDQLPDPTMEAALGVGKVPAMRGFSYVVFNRFPLEKFGNRIPSFTFELLADTGTFTSLATARDTSSAFAYLSAVQLLNGNVVALGSPSAGNTRIVVFDPADGSQLTTVDHAWEAASNPAIFIPPTNELWVIDTNDIVHRLNADTFAELGQTSLAFTNWNSIELTYDPAHRIVLANRASSQVGATRYFSIDLRGVVQDDYSDGPFYVYNVIAGGSNVIVTTGSPDIAVLIVPPDGSDPVVASQSDSVGAGCWDPMRKRYVVVQDYIWTITDANPPVIEQYTNTGSSFGIIRDVQYIPAFDAIAVWSTIVGIMELHLFDADTFELLYNDNDFTRLGATAAFLSPIDPGTAFIVGSYRPYEVNIVSTTVGKAVSDLCLAAGLEAADFDVTELTQRLRGYIVGQVMPARSAIEQLATAYLFEAAEIDDQLYFRRRGSAAVETIAAADCGAGFETPQEFAIRSVRAQESELPRRLTITAPDPAMDHQPATQYAERLVQHAGGEEQVQLAIVMTVAEAAQLALALLFDRWASRTRYEFSTGHEYARLVPTDPITLAGKRARIMARTHDGVLQRWEALADDADVLTQSTLGVAGQRLTTTIAVSSIVVPTTLVVLDTALLRDQDDTPGAYVALGGQAPYWRGAVLYVSDNDGVTYSRLLTMPTPGSSGGVAVNALADWSGDNVFDETNVLTVAFLSGQPTGTTRLGVLNGDNALAVQSGDGWEILQFRDALLNDDSTYTLSGLLRGRFGTEWAMAGHAVSDRVVMLTTASIRELEIAPGLIGVERLYKAASVGDTLAKTPSEAHTITAKRLVPLSPVHVGYGFDAVDNIIIQWTRRTRIDWQWRDLVDVALGEATEAYEVDIFEDDTEAVVMRTLTASTPTVTYTAAQQTTDFGQTVTTLYFRVYQLSASVGRGVDAPPEPTEPTAVPEFTGAVSFLPGSYTVGATLNMSFDAPTQSPTSYTYDVLRNGAPIGGASGTVSVPSASYTTTGADEDQLLSFSVTATNAIGTSAPAVSAQIEILAAPGPGDFGDRILYTNFGPGVSLYEVSSYRPSGFFQALTGTDSSTGFNLNAPAPLLWGSKASWFTHGAQLQWIGNAAASPVADDWHTLDILSGITGPTGAPTNVLRHKYKRPYQSAAQVSFMFQPNTSLPQGMYYERLWIKLLPGFNASWGSGGRWYQLLEWKQGENTRAQVNFDKDTGAARIHLATDCMQAGYVGGQHFAQWAAVYPRKYGPVLTEGQWYKVEFATRASASGGLGGGNGFSWLAVDGVEVGRHIGQNCFDGSNAKLGRVFIRNHYGNCASAGIETYATGLEVWESWPSDAAPHAGL